MAAPSFYWHDYETFGTDPARDRPVQFAGLRTDAELNVIGEPLVIYARPANDFLPQPGACLVTGITPQLALERGLPECEFIARIHRELAQPGTCGVGYNSLRFDDEVTRFTLYRNFFDPYAREWQNGNSRWDLIDVLRTAWALRPEGIEWPLREDGRASFRLEDLTAANGIEHSGAHDALADVEATIAVARLVRQRQPRLFDYLLALRDKRAVQAMLDIPAMKPVLHVSGMFGAQRHNIALIVPLAKHPSNRNEVICFDLHSDPAMLRELPTEELQRRLFSRASELAEGEARPGLKSVHINRCPVLAPAKMADPATAARVGLDGERCRAHLAQLRAWQQEDPEGMQATLRALYEGRSFEPVSDPDRMLYSGGFFSDSDRASMQQIQRATPAELAQQTFVFEDTRLPEMLFRYRARNYPDSLDEAERAQWEEFRYQRLTDPEAGGSLVLEDYLAEVESLLEGESAPGRQRVLQALLEYSDQLLA